MSDKNLIIADGHHRYETSVAYMHERAAELGLEASVNDLQPSDNSGLPQPPFSEAAMMMTFVNIDAPGITILPTHRVVFGLPGFRALSFAKDAARLFDVDPLSSNNQQPLDAPQLLDRLHQTSGVAFIAVTRGGSYLLTPKPEPARAALAALSPRQAELDVVQLHTLALEGLLGLDEEAVRSGNHVRYLRDADEAIREVRSGEADIAFLIKSVTLDQMKDISLNLEVMPQKSTDFYPKLLSGLAMYALD